jgi:phosphoribosyl-ATP pyrophosphohydrolase
MSEILDQLFILLSERKRHPTPTSYTSRLLVAGEDEVLKKIGEEAMELILAAKGQGDQRVVEEAADLVYHLLVLLVGRQLTWEDISDELEKRRSGW